MRLLAKTKDLIPAPQSAVRYYITCTTREIPTNDEGIPNNPEMTITFTEWKKVGSGSATVSSDLVLRIYLVLNGTKTYIGESNQAPAAYVTVALAVGKDSILAELLSDNDDIVDSFSVPLVKPGKDASTYEIIPSVTAIHADKDGDILTGVIEVRAFVTKAGIRTSCALGNVDSVYKVQFQIDNGTWTDCSNIVYSDTIVYGVPGSSVATITEGIAFRLMLLESGSYAVKHEMGALQVICDGQTGATGPTGRMYYFDGYYSETKTYTRDDYKTPFVAVDTYEDVTDNGVTTTVCVTSYHMLIRDSNVISRHISPTDHFAPLCWSPITTDFKYMINEAIFSSFAKLGSWIVKGDYFITQKGGSGNDTTDTHYENFTGDSGQWIPNILLNARDGSGWLAHRNIRWDEKGNPTFKGTVKAENFFHSVCFLGTKGNAPGCMYSTRWGTLMDRTLFENWLYHGAFFDSSEIETISHRFRLGETYDGNTLLGSPDGTTNVYLYEAFEYGIGYDDVDWNLGNGWIWNTGNADKVVIFDGVTSVELPPPYEFAGKHIEVYALRSSGQSVSNLKIRCSSGQPYGYYSGYIPTQILADSIFMKVRETGVVFDDEAYVKSITIKTGKKATFVSVCSSDVSAEQTKYGWFLQEVSNINETA